MKKKMLLAALAATGIVAYLVRKNRSVKNKVEHEVARSKNHLTDAFSRAKNMAASAMG